MRALLIGLCLCACGKSPTNDKPAAQSAAQPAAAPKTASCSGTLAVSGAWSGTLQCSPELAITCLANRDVGTAFTVTMTDGKDAYFAIDYVDVKNQPGRLQLTSGKLAANSYKATSGVTASIGDNSLAVSIDATFTHEASTVAVKGKLDFVCPY